MAAAATLSPFVRLHVKKPVLRAIRLEEAIADLMDAEKIVAELENTDMLRAFNEGQRTHYYAARLLLRELLNDWLKDTDLEQLAS